MSQSKISSEVVKIQILFLYFNFVVFFKIFFAILPITLFHNIGLNPSAGLLGIILYSLNLSPFLMKFLALIDFLTNFIFLILTY